MRRMVLSNADCARSIDSFWTNLRAEWEFPRNESENNTDTKPKTTILRRSGNELVNIL